ncbi:hypothetical protein [Desulfovibrio inopinatus]|uniref:hypothetical protein n=1 Tax=Desulfovibrio inopinatus TaxID=102109 RepID=UPI000401D599|nr:hypothetical protein [Desulfovibrio inopinatus]
MSRNVLSVILGSGLIIFLFFISFVVVPGAMAMGGAHRGASIHGSDYGQGYHMGWAQGWNSTRHSQQRRTFASCYTQSGHGPLVHMTDTGAMPGYTQHSDSMRAYQ